MALKLLIPFSFPFPSPHHPKLPSSSSSSSSSPFLFPIQPRKTLIPISSSSSSSTPLSPIFLPHLEPPLPQTPPVEDDDEEEEEDDDDDELVGEVAAPDPFLSFFDRRRGAPVDDPKHEGRLSLQRSRRSSWHVADLGEAGDDDGGASKTLVLESGVESSDSEAPEDGVVGEIVRLAKSLPENATLGECLGSYEGRIGEGECVELMERLGEEGLVWECLYLFEWMGLQEPLLVTPRTCSIVFPVLGRAGMGEKLMVLFENLPRGRQFRDVRVYNAAISGLACCRR